MQKDKSYGKITWAWVKDIKAKVPTSIKQIRKYMMIWLCLRMLQTQRLQTPSTKNPFGYKLGKELKEILDKGLDKETTKHIITSDDNPWYIMWKKSIEWTNSFWKQNIKEQSKSSKECNHTSVDIHKELSNIGLQLKEKDNVGYVMVEIERGIWEKHKELYNEWAFCKENEKILAVVDATPSSYENR